VTVVHTMDHLTPWWWHPWNAETCRRFLCICCAYIPEHLKSLLCIDFHTMHSTRNIKIETVFTVRYEPRWKKQLWFKHGNTAWL